METFVKLLILIILGIAARGVYLGLTKKAVFYMDKEDLFLSFSAWIAIVVGYIIGGFLEWDWVISLGYLVSISIIIYNAKQTYIYNNNNINYAIPIGIAKTLLSLLYLVTLINAVPSDKRTFRGDSIALAIAGLFSVLLYKLINSEEINTEFDKKLKWKIKSPHSEEINTELDYDKRLREWKKEDGITADSQLDYRTYFNEKLKKWKIKTPQELSETDKKKFYDEVDREWTDDEDIELFEKDDYKAFFNKKLKQYNIKSTNELSQKEKDKFYNECEKEWTEDEEKQSNLDSNLQDKEQKNKEFRYIYNKEQKNKEQKNKEQKNKGFRYIHK